jgi:hypothetical protein
LKEEEAAAGGVVAAASSSYTMPTVEIIQVFMGGSRRHFCVIGLHTYMRGHWNQAFEKQSKPPAAATTWSSWALNGMDT